MDGRLHARIHGCGGFRYRELALLFRTLATLRTDIPLFDDVEQLQWTGPTPAFAALGARLDGAVTEKRRPRPPRNAHV